MLAQTSVLKIGEVPILTKRGGAAGVIIVPALVTRDAAERFGEGLRGEGLRREGFRGETLLRGDEYCRGDCWGGDPWLFFSSSNVSSGLLTMECIL